MPSVWARETNAFQSSSREADAALLFGNGSAPPLGGSARQPSVGRGKPGLSRARPRARGPWNTAGSAASEDMPRKPLAGKAWWRIGHWGVRFLPMVAELAAVVAMERPASGARRPKAGGVRMEARRAKTRRASGRGLVHDSRPPDGGTPVARWLVSPSVYWWIAQKIVAIPVNSCDY
uniref:Uncharacterized protein n=1 Tax=Pseudomonas putida TaxID=303 RepID=A0A290GFV2_PSEPU|nr:hypothetical protein [Pseudomonas putida]